MTYEEIIGRWAAMIPADVKPQIDVIAARCRDFGVKVASYSLVYNHEPFLRECLDGIVMQQTSFPYVAIVHDDASTDGSRAIIEEYARRYPDLIFPIYESENQYRRPGGPLTYIIHAALAATGCEYVAICEGDDYWTSPAKLQLQADFLDAHPAYSMCTHNYSEYIQDTGELRPGLDVPSHTYYLREYVNFREWIYLTLSIMYRRAALDLIRYLSYRSRRDTVLIYHLLTNGDGFYFHDEMGVYRRHSGGIWTSIGKYGESKAWDIDHNVRMGIYKVEKSDSAAEFLINGFVRRNIPRSYIIKQYTRTLRTIRIYFKHFGLKKTGRVLKDRMIKNHVSC